VVATLLWRTPGWVYGTYSHTRRGLVVPVGRSLLGPADILSVPAGARGKGQLSVTTQPVTTLDVGPATGAAALLRLAPALDAPAGPAPRLRVPTGPEDCLLVG